MNNRELRVQDLISGFRRDWKLFLVIVAGFLLLGLAAGFFFSGRASAEGSGSAQAWEPVDFAEVPMGITYYVDCYDYIKEQRKVLCSYIDGVRNDSSITESQQEQLLEMKEEILIFDEDELVPIYWDLNAPDAFYLPDELRQSTLAQYRRERETLLQNISKSEYARSLLDTVGGLSTSDAAVNEIYASILSQAAEYRQLQLDLEQLDTRLNLLENEYPALRQASEEMAQRLDDAARALDARAEPSEYHLLGGAGGRDGPDRPHYPARHPTGGIYGLCDLLWTCGYLCWRLFCPMPGDFFLQKGVSAAVI